MMKCRHWWIRQDPYLDEEEEDDELEIEDKRKWCPRNKIWRRKGTLIHLFPNTITITEYCKGIYWFSEMVPDHIGKKHSRLGDKACGS